MRMTLSWVMVITVLLSRSIRMGFVIIISQCMSMVVVVMMLTMVMRLLPMSMILFSRMIFRILPTLTSFVITFDLIHYIVVNSNKIRLN